MPAKRNTKDTGCMHASFVSCLLSAFMASSTATHHCLVCGRNFSRREHLKRHVRSHTREKPFQCRTCGKSFCRSDILARHLASHEQDTLPPPPFGTSTRACCQCAATRVRCTRGHPCQRCQLRNLVCSYPEKRRHLTNSSPMLTEPPSGPLFGPDTTSVPEPASISISDLPWVAPAWEGQVTGSLGELGAQASDAPFLLDAVGPGREGSIWGDMGWSTPCPQLETASWAMTGPVSSTSAQSGTMSDNQSIPSSTMDPVSSPHSTTSTSTTGRYYVDGGGARAPFNGQLLRRHGRRRASASTGLEGPHVGPGDSDLLLDDPCMPGEDVILVTGEAYTQMISSLEPTSLSLEAVRTYVAAYFENFHPTFPFLRWHSFAQEACGDWMLLLAVAITGSTYVDSRLQRKNMLEALEKALSKIDDQSRLWVPGQEDEALLSCSLSRLQARILWVVCMAHTGQTEDLKKALLGRHGLVEACDRMGLLKRSREIKDVDWRSRECRLRTGMMVWVSLFSLSFHVLD